MKNKLGFFQAWLLCLVALGLQLLAVSTASAAAFVNTSPMSTNRSYHTATLLPDGKVLVTGGYNPTGGILKNVELYDPATGIWSATTPMTASRDYHAAILLPNGKVLVTGGTAGEAPNGNSSDDLYDPATGTWTRLGDSPSGPTIPNRLSHTATLLPNGKVLVAGGWSLFSGIRSSSELYDPTDGTNGSWTFAGSMSVARYLHTATLLPNGKVLIAGGGNDTEFLSSAELYDPATGWTATGSMSVIRAYHTATLLPNGKVLVVGGNGNFSAPGSAELYDPATGTWTPTGSTSILRFKHTATLLPNGKVLVSGGSGPISGGTLSSAELYDPATGTWTATGPLNASRQSHTATLLPNGDVLVTGGIRTNTIPHFSAELYQEYPPFMAGQLLGGGDMQLSYLGGIAGRSYALDRTFNLAPPDWIPQITNPAVVSGVLSFTNTPVPSTNNFWRIRSVP